MQLVDDALAHHRERLAGRARVEVAQGRHRVDAQRLQLGERGTPDAPDFADRDPDQPKGMLLLLLVPALVFALGGAPTALATPRKGANGGPVVVVDGHPVEMVASDTAVTFYLSDDDGSPLSTKGLTARAVVRIEGKTLTVLLTPEAPN